MKIIADKDKSDLILENDQLKKRVQDLENCLKEADVNIVHLKKCEITLKESEESLRLLNENMIDVIGQVDTKGNLVYATPSIESVVGYKTDQLLGKSIFDGIHPEDKDEILEEFKNIFNPSGKGVTVQYRYKHANGEYIWLETNSKAFFKENVLMGSTFSTRDIRYRKNIENQLKKTLTEKNTLIKDIHHRVKNNMQIISSLLNLQEQWIGDEKTLKIFRDSQNRIKTMALVYQKIYQSNSVSKIDLDSYVPNLVSELISSSGVDDHITAHLDVGTIEMDINQAIPLALIINEVVTNSIKYAFPHQKKGIICLKIGHYNRGNEDYQMIISDNGIGLSDDVDLDNPSTLGLQLVQNLAKQLDGEITINNNNGVIVTMIFKDSNTLPKC